MKRGNNMRLKVENFAKIKNADIEINGITVIGGENNTGKSTIGKILYTIFTIFHNFEDKIKEEKIVGILRYLMREADRSAFGKIDEILSATEELVQSEKLDHKYVQELLNNKIGLQFNDEQIKNVLNRLDFETSRLESLVVNSIFNDEFNSQISPIYDEDLITKIELNIKNEKIKLEFNKETVYIKEKMRLINDGIYIDNPFIIDDIRLNKRNVNSFEFKFRYIVGKSDYDHVTSLDEKLSRSLKVKNESLIESDLLKERIEKFVKLIIQTVNGDFIEKEDEFVFFDNTYGKDVKLSNLSTGIKAFAIILKLLENNDLRDKSLIVLDEPEVHLHPKWQIVYAEILILLQKEFNLNVVLTTHSPYFINALELYSEKHGIEDKMKYYLSNLDYGACVFEDVTNNTGKLYSLLAEPFELFDSMEKDYDC